MICCFGLLVQIILLDEEGGVLATRYLKSGESLETGKKCHFPNYLIEICEAKSVNKGWFCAFSNILTISVSNLWTCAL